MIVNGVSANEVRRIKQLIKSKRVTGRYKDGTIIQLIVMIPTEKRYVWRIVFPSGPWKDVTVLTD